jgi:adenosylcobinamide kinase/adenosylcobinamide-phosphate guanylyltransferase
MKETIFIVGGCRSGKSRYALETSEKFRGDKKVFIATCVPHDEEMKLRIAKHKKERRPGWITVEEPVHLPEAIAENGPQATVILVDCLTLWVTNLLLETNDEKKIEAHVAQLIHALAKADSNEVGTGIVPENKLARQFRDMLGIANQAVAKTAGKVVWMVAGLPVTIK